jgi:hypothetical protein
MDAFRLCRPFARTVYRQMTARRSEAAVPGRDESPECGVTLLGDDDLASRGRTDAVIGLDRESPAYGRRGCRAW